MMAAKKPSPGARPLEPGQDGYEPSTSKLFANTATDRGKTPGGRQREVGVQGVHQLSGNAEVAARTGPDAKADGKFRKTFVLSGRDYEANAENDDMHRANEVATVQEALMRGVHATEEADLESTEVGQDGSVRLTYAVSAVPASEDENPAEATTPASVIKAMGGSTIETAQDSIAFGTKGARTATEK